jgi:hypothetical protein
MLILWTWALLGLPLVFAVAFYCLAAIFSEHDNVHEAALVASIPKGTFLVRWGLNIALLASPMAVFGAEPISVWIPNWDPSYVPPGYVSQDFRVCPGKSEPDCSFPMGVTVVGPPGQTFPHSFLKSVGSNLRRGSVIRMGEGWAYTFETDSKCYAHFYTRKMDVWTLTLVNCEWPPCLPCILGDPMADPIPPAYP